MAVWGLAYQRSGFAPFSNNQEARFAPRDHFASDVTNRKHVTPKRHAKRVLGRSDSSARLLNKMFSANDFYVVDTREEKSEHCPTLRVRCVNKQGKIFTVYSSSFLDQLQSMVTVLPSYR